MIDTVMALWNQGSQHKGVRVLFTLLLVCMSISLLFVTIIIPGYILFSQEDSGMMTQGLESNVVAPIQGGGGMFMATPKAFGRGSSKLRKCVTSTAQKEPQRRAQVAEDVGPQTARVLVSPGIPTAVPSGESHKDTKVSVKSHHVFAGKPGGSVSHIHAFGQQGGRASQNAQATVVPFASAVVPRIRVSVTGKTQMRLHTHVASASGQGNQFQAKSAPMQTSSPITQMLTKGCIAAGS